MIPEPSDGHTPRPETSEQRAALVTSEVCVLLGCTVMYLLAFVPEDRRSPLLAGSLLLLYPAAAIQFLLAGYGSIGDRAHRPPEQSRHAATSGGSAD
ncbi:MAG: hypothetical protein ACK5PP_02960 [Acidimicrobiales bacterium]